MPSIVVNAPFNKKFLQVLSAVQIQMMTDIDLCDGWSKTTEKNKRLIMSSLAVNIAVEELCKNSLSVEYYDKMVYLVDQAIDATKDALIFGVIASQSTKDEIARNISDLEHELKEFRSNHKVIDSPPPKKNGSMTIVTPQKTPVFFIPEYVAITRSEILQILQCQTALLSETNFFDSYKDKEIAELMLNTKEMLVITYLLVSCKNFPKKLLPKLLSLLDVFEKQLLPIFDEYKINGVDSKAPVKANLEKLLSVLTVLGLAEIFKDTK